MSAAQLPHSSSSPAYDPYLEAGAQAEQLGAAWVWTPPAAGLPATLRDPSSWYSVRQAFWKIHTRLPDFLASWPRGSRLRPGWSRCSGWSGRPYFRQVLSFLHLPLSPPLALGAGIALAGATFCPPIPIPLLQGSLQACVGLLGYCGLLDFAGETGQASRKFGPGRLLAEAYAVSSPERPRPKPQHQGSLRTVGPDATGVPSARFPRCVSLLLPSHKRRPPERGPQL